jgi:hypothetical protein
MLNAFLKSDMLGGAEHAQLALGQKATRRRKARIVVVLFVCVLRQHARYFRRVTCLY